MTHQCSACRKQYSNKSNLSQHVRNKHPELISHKLNCRCLEDRCHNAFRKRTQLRDHLRDVHGKKFEEMKFTVSTMSEFEEWKKKMEKETASLYFLHRKFMYITYYYCNRSRTTAFKRLDDKIYKRQEKSQGSCKMPYNCTSYIKLEHEKAGEIKVFWQKTHYGHIPQLQHIRLSKDERSLVASKLSYGVPPTKILQATANSISIHPKRIDLLTREDIKNIKGSFRIEGDSGKRHENDAISVDLWVEECKNNEADKNPVLFYKAQGMEGEGFSPDDFCLVIMNPIQKEMFQKFGENIIAIDGTHGLNGYDFELITLMVVDEFNRGFPVAFMFTNRKDTFVYLFFFDLIKTNAGLLQAKTFMSDLEGAFYSAWEKVMGPTKHTLFCSWHVHRAWQSNLNKIANKTRRSEVYKHLKVLQKETEANTFQTSLNTFISRLMNDSETAAFGKYFQNHYCNNFSKWAYCFRKDCGINTNMRLESMHKVIKYFHLDRKVVRRLDKGLHAVMGYLKNRTLSRLIDLSKGKTTKQTRLNFERHNKALTSTYNLTERYGAYTLTTESSKLYEIKKNSNLKCCQNICTACQVCRHMFTCTCPDFLRNNLVCKHIHYVIFHEKRLAPSTSSSSTTVEMKNYDGANVAQQLGLCQQSTDDDNQTNCENNKQPTINAMQAAITAMQTGITVMQAAISELSKETGIKDYDIEGVKEITNCTMRFVNSTKMERIPTSFQQVTRCEPKNKININPQIRFTSTKKKRKTNNTNVPEKPNPEEIQDIKNILLGGDSLFISKDSSLDHNYI